MRTSIKLPLVALASLLVAFAVATAPAMAEEFGLRRLAVSARNQDGTPDVQAGSHPYSFTSTFVLNESAIGTQGGSLRDVKLELPSGFVGDPNATPHCSYQAFIQLECPNETAIGINTTYLTESLSPPPEIYRTSDAVYNLVPPAGVAAEFGFIVAGEVPVFLQTTVRTGTDYGLTVTAPNIPQAAVILADKVTIWGVPANPAHNPYRGNCIRNIADYVGHTTEEIPNQGLREGEDEMEGPVGPGGVIESKGECSTQTPELQLLTNPTSCGIPRSATESVDDWEEPGNVSGARTKTITMPEMSGCEKLDFSPTVNVTPDGTAGSTPTGLTVGVHVPQETTENPKGLAEADVKNTTVTLPEGVQLSPSAADGQQACSTSQIGFLGFKELDPSREPGVQTAQFTPNAPTCPNASKVANVHITTPHLLEKELVGSVYLAAPQNFVGALENPFGALVSLYLVAEEPLSGVIIKVAGKVVPNPRTGQLVSTFENTPQAAYTDLKLEFFGTARAPLSTPEHCGTYTTDASFQPWSGTPAVDADSSFEINSGPQVEGPAGVETLPCSDPLPFKPTLESGTTNIDAGAFSTLDTTFSREDGQQTLSSIELHYPNGIAGLLQGVKLCGEAQANAGTCGPESEIGETIVSVGLGSDPFNVVGGKVYITEKYEGAPFGLSIVNPAKAGPFVLQEGRPVVVRAKIEVNPVTAALTVVTDPPGSAHAIPTIIDGIPLQVKHVNAIINRPGFTFNPTNCTPSQVTGTIHSTEGAASPVSVPFQVTNCASLKFEPKFTVSTSGKTSRANGASLHVNLSYPAGALGKDANIAKIKVDLPKQLPSRLTTLQKACTNAQFEADPAGCPIDSRVGQAKAITPLIPVPLEGPAYFVSHGGAKFPELIMVLEGYGVTLDVHGETFISKAGITSSTFSTIPDDPVGNFELTLPQGSDSALAANGNLCKSKLAMPTAFIGQNGAEIHESTPITATGCPKAVRHERNKKRTKRKKK